jgi:hypothetical protein
MLELLTWVNQFFSFHLFILRVLYFFPAGTFMDRNKFTSFFFNIVRKIDAFIFLDVVIVIFVICLHFDSLIDINERNVSICDVLIAINSRNILRKFLSW